MITSGKERSVIAFAKTKVYPGVKLSSFVIHGIYVLTKKECPSRKAVLRAPGGGGCREPRLVAGAGVSALWASILTPAHSVCLYKTILNDGLLLSSAAFHMDG